MYYYDNSHHSNDRPESFGLRPRDARGDARGALRACCAGAHIGYGVSDHNMTSYCYDFQQICLNIYTNLHSQLSCFNLRPPGGPEPRSRTPWTRVRSWRIGRRPRARRPSASWTWASRACRPCGRSRASWTGLWSGPDRQTSSSAAAARLARPRSSRAEIIIVIIIIIICVFVDY